MRKLLTMGLVLCAGITFAQQDQPQMIRCGTTNLIDYQDQKTPGYKEAVKTQFNIAKNAVNNKSDETYIIPVVVHIVYKNDDENLPDSVVFSQIATLNEDYMRLNADTVDLRSEFLPLAGNANIQFQLAQVDPDGNPTTGITRTSTTESFGGLMDMTNSEKVKSTAQGGIDPWDQNKYMNIWVCDMSFMGIPMVLGYATPPSGLSNWPPGSTDGMDDGVVIQYQAFGKNNPVPLEAFGTSIEVMGRTTTHEVGHYLGLRHIWGDGDCTEDDGIDDTPNSTDSSNGCDKTANKCVDNILGQDLPDMLENYMDYSDESCQNTFTKGQVELMRSVLENQRYDLVHDNDGMGIEKEETIVAALYPNPSREVLNVILSKGNIQTIHVFNTQGQALDCYATINSENAQLDVSSLDAGVYMVSIQNDQGVTTVQRFIRE